MQGSIALLSESLILHLAVFPFPSWGSAWGLCTPSTQKPVCCLRLPSYHVPSPHSTRGAHREQDVAPQVPVTTQGAVGVISRGTSLWEHPVDRALSLLWIPIPPSQTEAADTCRALWQLQQLDSLPWRCLGGLHVSTGALRFGLGVVQEEDAEMPGLRWRSSSGARAVLETSEGCKGSKVRGEGHLSFQP